MPQAERTFEMAEPSAKAREDVFLMLFKEMVEDATAQLKEACPHLARIVEEQRCGR